MLLEYYYVYANWFVNLDRTFIDNIKNEILCEKGTKISRKCEKFYTRLNSIQSVKLSNKKARLYFAGKTRF